MKIIDLLTELRRNNIKLSVHENELKITAPKNIVTSEIRELVASYKNDIIDIVSKINNDVQVIKTIDRSKKLPLSYAQQRLWFIDQFEGGKNTHYNMPQAFRLMGELDVTALKAAFNKVTQRHESLRTTFQNVEGEATQVILNKLTLDIPIIHITENDICNYINQFCTHVFDLTTGPLIKVELLELSSTEHILLINIHHIVSDGWSVDVLNHELSVLYMSYKHKLANPLPPLPIQFVDFANWQCQWLKGKILQRQIDYWRAQLADSPALLELPTDRPRPAQQSYRGSHHFFTIPKILTQKLHSLSLSEGTTLFMTLLATFYVLLARYSGQTDICVGTPIANRQRQELDGLIGFFANTLVLRMKIKNDISFSELLHQVKNTALSAYDHQDVPFERLVEILKPGRSMSYSPLFQIMFILQNSPLGNIDLPQIRVSPLTIETHTTKFDLLFGLFETQETIEGILEYNTDLFDQATIEQMSAHYELLLKAVVDNSNNKIYKLPLLTETEYHRIIYEWNRTNITYPRINSIQQLFEKQVKKTPDAIAAKYKDQQITYYELNRRSNQVAYHLIKKGIGPDVTVGLCLKRSLEMIICILGILKADGVYVPLDPEYPQERLEHMLKHANVNIILSHKELDYQISLDSNIVIYMDLNNDFFKEKIGEKNPINRINPENLAYIIYTSGSTGKPKAVAMQHKALTNLIHWQIENSSCSVGSRTLQFSNISFDVSFQEIFSTLCSGGSIVLIHDDLRRDPFLLWHFLTDFLINRIFMPFISLQQLSEAYNTANYDVTPTALKEVITAGEQLQITPLIRSLFKQLHGCKLYNHYGPSETHVVTALELEGPADLWEPLPTIGTPIANNTIYILDKILQPVPIGVLGEIYIGGLGLARGYLNNDELTDERFIVNPFGSGLIYKTGDIGRYRNDGKIEFKGRLDNQIKVRGYRIEPGEIENLLNKQPGVKETIVISRTNSRIYNDKYLVAYIVLKEGLERDQNTLRNALKKLLPDYMIPSAFIFLEKLPLTPNGKVDHELLQKQNNPTQQYNASSSMPRDNVEFTLMKIWSELLDCVTIGIRDDFFDLGGHSLLAVRLISRIKTELGQELPLSILFKYPTIEQLASKIRSSIQTTLTWSPLVPIQPKGKFTPLFCVHPAGGTVFCYMDLAKMLQPKEQPLYGLQARGIIEGQEPSETIEEAAEYYINAIREVQHKGPYYLLGWSSGGTVAFEMAQQLHQIGEKVAFIGLLDTRILDSSINILEGEELLITLLIVLTGDLLIKLPHEIIDKIKSLSEQNQIAQIVKYAKECGFLTPDITISYAERLMQVSKRNMQFMQNYKPKPFNGVLALFRAAQLPDVDPGGSFNWHPYASKLIEYETPGKHGTMVIPPHVQTLSEIIWDCLNKCHSENTV